MKTTQDAYGQQLLAQYNDQTANAEIIEMLKMKKFVFFVAVFFFPGSVCIGQQKMKPLIPVLFNHFFVVVDSDTYKAIESDDFLRKEFAVSEKRTTVRADSTYTATYFYGVNTYFEFFDIASDAKQQFGESGFALGVDYAGQLEILTKDLAAEFAILPQPVTRQFNSKQVDWFYMGVPKNFTSPYIRIWLMEYHPRFLSFWNSTGKDKDEGVTRKQILQRYRDVLKAADSKTYLKDIVGMTIAVDKETGEKLAKLCQLLGYSLRTEGNAKLLTGHEITLRLIPETNSARGIKEITMSVNRNPGKKAEFKFGKSVLRFNDKGFATWSF